MMPSPMRIAVCPVWFGSNQQSTTSIRARRRARRYFTLSVMLGDVILTQPGAYAQVAVQGFGLSRTAQEAWVVTAAPPAWLFWPWSPAAGGAPPPP